MPLARTELFGLVHRRAKLLFADVDAIRISARVSTIGSTNAVLQAEYSLDETAWNVLSPTVAIGGGAAGTRVSAWGVLPAGARNQDVFVRVMGESGDGTADPVIGNVQVEYH